MQLARKTFPLAAQIAAKPEKKSLEREGRRELKLLSLAPGEPDELAGPLGGQEPLPRAVCAELLEAVDVHRGGLRPGGEDDEVAVPPLELLEQREEFLPLGAALRAPRVLLRLASRHLHRLEPGLGDGLSLASAFGDARDE